MTWRRIALGDNRYAVVDRGGLLLYVSASLPSTNLTWSWDEGSSFQTCSFASLGPLMVHGLSGSPSNLGARFHMLASQPGATPADAPQHFVVVVDFTSFTVGWGVCVCVSTRRCCSSLHGQGNKCQTADYEVWTPSDPDGPQGCLLGSQTSYTRRKGNVQCFNADNDIVHSTSNCTCSLEDYECDDCFERASFWNISSPCVPTRRPCTPPPNPCAHGESTFVATRGYRRVPNDVCVSDSSDSWRPLVKSCADYTVPPTVTATTVQPPTPSPTTPAPSVGPTQSSAPVPTSSGSHSTTAPSSLPTSPGIIVAVLLVVVVVGALVAAFFVLRRNPRFQAWANGRIPFVPLPESPYATLGELEQSVGDDDGLGDF